MAVSTQQIVLTEPFRLDLTASALRRVATNLVDVYTESGEYYRALADRGQLAVIRVRQIGDDRLSIDVHADAPDPERATSAARVMLGMDRSVSLFDQESRKVPWLARLADRYRGLRPPRFPSLWESFVNTVVFQQVSLQSASAITRRLIGALGETVEINGHTLHVFPGEDAFHRSADAPLRAAGLSATKLRTLREAAEAVRSGEMSAERLEALRSPEAARELQTIRGIGPWTAAVILLRGLGRLDVFPPNDSGVNANLRRFAETPVDVPALLEALGEQRGMLYFYLLMGRLEADGRLAEPSIAWAGRRSERAPR